MTSSATDQQDFFLEKPLFRWLLIGILCVLALGIRVYRISDPPLEFNSSRQYQGALLTRYYYYMADPAASEWQRQRAEAQKPPNYEPPVMEKITAQFYRITGRESFWFPRLLSVIFWLIGGAGIFLLSKKLWNKTAAVLSLTVFLFLPFGILASRSFLPEPMMVMFMILSYLAIVHYTEKPNLLRLMIAAVLAAAAIFIKVQSVFMVLGAFGALMISRKKIRQVLVHLHSWIFFFVASAPGAIYYLRSLFISETLQSQASWSFMPRLFFTSLFYKGWFQNVGLIVGFGLLILTLLALPLIYSRKTPRALLLGLGAGYIMFCVVFNYHASTHHYYHLQIIPLVAVSVGFLGAVIFARLNESRTPWKLRAAILTVVLVAFALDGVKQVVIRRNWQERNMDFAKVVEVAEEIGNHVDHSLRCIFLDPEYGSTLKYHGWLSGWIWYSATDISINRTFRGSSEKTAQELYFRKYAGLKPRFFIVTDFKEFERQSDLKEFLTSRFQIMASTPWYLIFDLARELK